MGNRKFTQEQIVERAKQRIKDYERMQTVALNNHWVSLYSYYSNRITDLKVELAEEKDKLKSYEKSTSCP